MAQTPDGTRVATPNPSKGPSTTPPRGSALQKASYAAALKAKPSDWHLEFSMDDHNLPLDLTIYGAIHQHEARKKTGQVLPPSMIWQGIYTVKFKKISGPAPSNESRWFPFSVLNNRSRRSRIPARDDSSSRSKSPVPASSSLPEDTPHGKILRLLKVLHKLNADETERTAPVISRRALAESAFVNNKLTAKLTRQLEEPMIVAR